MQLLFKRRSKLAPASQISIGEFYSSDSGSSVIDHPYYDNFGYQNGAFCQVAYQSWPDNL